MKTKEKIDYAVSRIKELFLLINSWTRGVSDKTSEYNDIKKRKQQLIEDLYTEIGELNRVWNEQELELTTKEYINLRNSLTRYICRPIIIIIYLLQQ